MTGTSEETIGIQSEDVIQVKKPQEGKPSRLFLVLEYIVYFVSGGIGLLLIVRFFLKLAGAGPSSEFVSIIYNISNYLIAPFEGIFKTTNSQGAETTSVFEPSTVITFIVFWVVSAIIVWVLRVIFRKN